MYTKQQLKVDAIAELRKLDELLFEDEREFLDEDRLNPFKMSDCIYGQITGDCSNERAVELINKCAVRLIGINAASSFNFSNSVEDDYTTLPREKGLMNWLSPLEVYIMFNEGKEAIRFLKREKEAPNA